MRFMIIVKSNRDIEAGKMPTEAQLANMTAYNEEMLKAGVFLTGEGLHPTAKGARIRFREGEPIITDGPFAEAKEIIAGFTMIEVASKEEALEWIKKWPHTPEDGEFDLELRQVFAPEDFGEEYTPELREREERMRAEAERNAAGG
ncbi:MAG TPA: YciI family protein [Dermatophilaceae bacterium]|nr:YciI family protein [Dermatophilaceae bacterium]